MDSDQYIREVSALQRTQRSSSDPDVRKSAGRRIEQLRQQRDRQQSKQRK